jgi:hypothetical protein
VVISLIKGNCTPENKKALLFINRICKAFSLVGLTTTNPDCLYPTMTAFLQIPLPVGGGILFVVPNVLQGFRMG